MGVNDHRARHHLIAAGQLYPGAWRQFDEFRRLRGRDLPDWPGYVYCPLAAAYSIVSGGGMNRVPPHMAGDVGRLGALAAWRPTQGIYRYDPTLFAALVETDLSGDLPCETLHRLPEWCVYVETPGMDVGGPTLYGFFAHLEWDANHDREELRLLLDSEAALAPVPIHLGPWPLGEAVARAMDVIRTQAAVRGESPPDSMAGHFREIAEPLVSLLLYLCADDAEVGDGTDSPTMPQPKRTKQGWRIFPAKRVRPWDVGTRIGAALRRAYQQQETGQQEIDPETGRARPRAHIRRAHWHTFRTGEGRTERRLKWLPPIAVNVDDASDLPTTIRRVKR